LFARNEPGVLQGIARVSVDLDEVSCRHFAGIPGNEVILNAIILIKRSQTSLLDRRHVDENVLGPVFRRDESITFGRVKPLDSTCSH